MLRWYRSGARGTTKDKLSVSSGCKSMMTARKQDDWAKSCGLRSSAMFGSEEESIIHDAIAGRGFEFSLELF